MTITQALQKNSDVETDILLSYILKKQKEFLYLHPDTKLTKEQSERLATLLKRRRAGEPIAYIVGHKYFFGLKFKVNKHVLIPRPETEWLVERTLHYINTITAGTKAASVNILDVGTGSGCIAISIAHVLREQNPKARITASDISNTALAVAMQNAKAHHVNIQFLQSDLFANIQGKFDIIIANLPYVPQGMYELLHHNLQYEPKVAITDGGEVWEIYQRFFTDLPKHLKPGGIALLEMDDGAKPAMQKMLKAILPTWTVIFQKDLGSLWRFIELRALPTKR